MLLRAESSFRARPEGERNADLLLVLSHALVDTTYRPEGDKWEPKLVPQLVLA
jgi:hypothetical protein